MTPSVGVCIPVMASGTPKPIGAIGCDSESVETPIDKVLRTVEVAVATPPAFGTFGAEAEIVVLVSLGPGMMSSSAILGDEAEAEPAATKSRIKGGGD